MLGSIPTSVIYGDRRLMAGHQIVDLSIRVRFPSITFYGQVRIAAIAADCKSVTLDTPQVRFLPCPSAVPKPILFSGSVNATYVRIAPENRGAGTHIWSHKPNW